MKERVLIIVLCIVGLTAIFFGMVKDHDGVFIIGIIMVIGGYLMIRKRLKEAVPTKGGDLSNENTKENKQSL